MNLNPMLPPPAQAKDLAALLAILADPAKFQQQLQQLTDLLAEASDRTNEANTAIAQLAKDREALDRRRAENTEAAEGRAAILDRREDAVSAREDAVSTRESEAARSIAEAADAKRAADEARDQYRAKLSALQTAERSA